MGQLAVAEVQQSKVFLLPRDPTRLLRLATHQNPPFSLVVPEMVARDGGSRIVGAAACH